MERKADGKQSGIRMEGYLEKKRKSRLVSLWNRYWFVLKGAQLSYYDNRPTSAATSSKGFITLSSMTSVTAYSPTHRHPEAVHSSNCEIYILTPSKLLTLRTKDVNEHKTWMCAFLEQIATLTPQITTAVPFQSSHINHRHSLTSLTTMEDIDNKHLSKCSRTMEYKEFKSGSTGNILDRKVVAAATETDTESSSEDEVGVNKGQEGVIKTIEKMNYKHQLEKMSVNIKVSNEEADGKAGNISERLNTTIATDQKEMSLYQYTTKTVHCANKMEENASCKLKEVQSVQIQESKVKSRKFFGRREAKTNSVQMSGAKVYKKCRNTIVTERVDVEPMSSQASRGDKRSKLDESSKDESIQRKRTTDSRSYNSPTDYKVSVGHSQQKEQSSLPEKSEGMKPPNKPKVKRVKSKKERKGSQQSIEAQDCRRSKIAKTGELLDDGETKAKVKKIGFFSKFVKCKKNENSDEKSEEMERESSPDSSKEFKAPEEDQLTAREASPEKKISHLPRHRAPVGMLVPKDDAEFQKKLLSRKLKIEADQDHSVDVTEQENIKTVLPTHLHGKDDDGEDNDKPFVTVNVGGEEVKPSLPPRSQVPAPPIPERKINPTPLGSKRNLRLEIFPSINSKPMLSPKSPENYQHLGAARKNDYDIVKFKVKKKESAEKSELVSSQGMNPRLGHTLTSASSATMNAGEVHMESNDMNTDESRAEVKLLEREKTDTNFEEFRMAMPTITLDEIPSETSSIRSVSTIGLEEEVMDCLNTNINFGKRDSLEIPTMRLNETTSLNKHSVTEQKSIPICSSPVPIVTFSEIPSYSSIHTNAEVEAHDTPSSSTSFSKTYFSTSSKIEERTFNKVDELGLLLSELDRINAAPLENADSEEKPVLMPKEAKRALSDNEDFLEAFPIRKRRNSDPDYDIPRPHRLPKQHQVSQDLDKNDFSKDENDKKEHDTNNSITIEATCFLGPGMDQSFNENRYYGFNSNDWSRKSDEIRQYLECKYGDTDVSEEKDSFLQNLKLGREDFEEKETKENFSASKSSEKHFEEKEGSSQESRRDSEISVNLRPEKIDRSCRNERSREVYQSDLDDIMSLTGTIEYLSINRTPDEDQAIDTSNQESDSLLQVDIPNNKPGAGKSMLEDCESRIERAGVEFEAVDSIANANKMAVTTTVADNERLLQELPVEMEAEESEVVLRNPMRSDVDEIRDNKTLRLSFATTETLIVEEEVLVASLKTTTTTKFSSPLEDQANNEEVEELVEEVVLDIDSIPDDHFGSMKIQSCVQT